MERTVERWQEAINHSLEIVEANPASPYEFDADMLDAILPASERV